MAIYKAKQTSNYLVIPNSTAQDKNLSFEARGVLVLMLSMPEDWAISNQWLINQTKAGKDKVNSIIKELIKFGYMQRAQSRNHGKFSSNDYLVFSEPQPTVDGFAVDGFAVSGKSATTKETLLQSKQETNIDQQADLLPLSQEEKPQKPDLNKAFDMVWKYWHNKVGKEEGRNSFLKTFKNYTREDLIAEMEHIEAYREYALNQLQNKNKTYLGFDAIHFSTFINNKRWLDLTKEELGIE